MKYVFVLCVLMVGAALGADTNLGHIGPYGGPEAQIEFPGTDDVIVSQPFIFSALVNGLGCSSGNSWVIADDATPAGSLPIGKYEFWALYTGTTATTWKISLRNNGTGPGTTVLWTQDVIGCVNTNTGLTSWGYAIYNIVALPTGTPYQTVAGTKIWMLFQSTNASAVSYFCASNQTWADFVYFSTDNGTSWQTSMTAFGANYELNIIVSTPVALERDTWGSIKSTF